MFNRLSYTPLARVANVPINQNSREVGVPQVPATCLLLVAVARVVPIRR